jgi:hypothetical protein
MLDQHLPPEVDESSRERLTLLVTGIIKAESASPARIAAALETLGLSDATAESIERRIRRIENDPELTASLCFHGFARQRLLYGRPPELLLSIDPTTQEERVVMLTVSIEYRGRALPLAWAVWPGNIPLEGEGFWRRVAALLDAVAQLLPCHVPVTIVADRAFGTPAFTDLVEALGWSYIVRVQGQTRCQDRLGREQTIRHLVRRRNQRAKMKGLVFKKRGWRAANMVVYWGKRHQSPLCLVSNRRAEWDLIALYRRRFPIEATFRDYKSHGWRWEQGQVSDLDHLERLLVGMALATWVALFAGTQVAAEWLARPPTGRRHTVPWVGKRSLFRLGLNRLHKLLEGDCHFVLHAVLTDWNAPNWRTQIYQHHVHAFIFAAR